MDIQANSPPRGTNAPPASVPRVPVQIPNGKTSAAQESNQDETPRKRGGNILTVCFGNLLRSPMAEALLRDRLQETDWQVSSAGTHALGGDEPFPLAQLAILEVAGLDIFALRSSPLAVQDILVSDYIFTMSRRQAAEVTALVPEVADRVRLLGSFAPLDEETDLSADPGGEVADPEEIGDPIGGDLEVCLACCRRIAEASDKIAAWLMSGADERLAPPSVASGLRVPTSGEQR